MSQSQRGFSPIQIIAGVFILFIVFSAVIFGMGKTRLLYSNKIPLPIYEYCSFNNGCPIDKCTIDSHCDGGGADFGCAIGKSTCEYKNGRLKADYKQVSPSEARKCSEEFLAKNKKEYPILDYFEMSEEDSFNESSGCIDKKAEDGGDDFCYFAMMKPKIENSIPFSAMYEVGAQTCRVYWDLREEFKEKDLGLNKIGYTPEEAVKCAEGYLSENRDKFVEYQSYEPGSLKAEEPGNHGGIEDHSEDWVFYTVHGKSAGHNLYLVVGGHSCKVYPVNEKYYTPIN